MNSELSSDEKPKSGSADSRIIEFAMFKTSFIIGIMSIRIPSLLDSSSVRPNIVIAPPSRDSSLTRGPQRLKPELLRTISARVELVPFPVRRNI